MEENPKSDPSQTPLPYKKNKGYKPTASQTSQTPVKAENARGQSGQVPITSRTAGLAEAARIGTSYLPHGNIADCKSHIIGRGTSPAYSAYCVKDVTIITLSSAEIGAAHSISAVRERVYGFSRTDRTYPTTKPRG